MRISYPCIASQNRGEPPYRKTSWQSQQHTDTGLFDMEPVILILLHLFRAWDPDLTGMSEPDTVKDQRIIPVYD